MTDERRRTPPEGLAPDALAPDDERPFEDDELLAAAATRDALEASGDDLAASLRAAWRGGDGGPPDHEALLLRVLGPEGAASDDEPPATEEERLAAVALRDALEPGKRDDAGSPGSPDLRLVEALRAAHAPRPIAPLRNELFVARAVRAGSSRRGSGVVRAAAGGALALAASVALAVRFFGAAGPSADHAVSRVEPAAAPAALIRSRSTAPLFDAAEPFPRTGGASDRVDRIASARASDLRANRFAAWGVR
jgi:hypothetical protein